MANTNDGTVTRRDFVGLFASAALAPALFARTLIEGSRLASRPGKPTGAAAVGLTTLWEGTAGAFLYIPRSYVPAKPVPLVLALHGATQRANSALRVWRPQADAAGFALLAVESTGVTWDGIRDSYGIDVRAIDRALGLTFARVNVDPRRVVMQGFSDGASYGLGLALDNRDLFRRIVANSPGFITDHDEDAKGPKPAIFLSHGHQDPILPFDRAGAVVVRQLRREGYTVQFREFDGGHAVPAEVASEATRFIVAP